jgi:hypothetical protein
MGISFHIVVLVVVSVLGSDIPNPASMMKTYEQLAKIHGIEGETKLALSAERRANRIAASAHLPLPFPSDVTLHPRETDTNNGFATAARDDDESGQWEITQEKLARMRNIMHKVSSL